MTIFLTGLSIIATNRLSTHLRIVKWKAGSLQVALDECQDACAHRPLFWHPSLVQNPRGVLGVVAGNEIYGEHQPVIIDGPSVVGGFV
jgi:hypothetical protein